MTSTKFPATSARGILQSLGFEISGRQYSKDISFFLNPTNSNLKVAVGDIVENNRNLNLRIHVTSKNSEKHPYNDEFFNLMNRISFVVERSPYTSNQFTRDSTKLFLSDHLEALNKYKKRMIFPSGFTRFSEANQNRRVLPFFLAGIPPYLASRAFKHNLPAYNPIITALADGIIGEADVEDYEILPISIQRGLLYPKKN